MPRYREQDYSYGYARSNIGMRFWDIYQGDLYELARDRTRKDIAKRIHDEWDSQGYSPFGTEIRIEWAMAIYDHGDWPSQASGPCPNTYQRDAH